MGSRRFVRKLEKSGASELVGGIHNEMFFDSSWPNPGLEEFLITAATKGTFDLNPWMEFSPTDTAQADFFRLRPRKVIEESQKDYERMFDDIELLPWIGSDQKRRYKIPQHIFLSRIRLKPNQVAVVGQWTAEYVIPQGVRMIYEQGRFDGIEFRPITNTRTGSTHEAFFHLFSDRTLGHRVLDIASPEILSELPREQGYDAYGCICYESGTLEDARDFNRTGERMLGFRFPDWIVRAVVREQFLENKLRGWAFEPVLEIGTGAYQDYTELWSSFYGLLAKCECHTVRGQKIESVSNSGTEFLA